MTKKRQWMMLIPEDLHYRFKLLAVKRKTNMTAIILELIERELSESEKNSDDKT